MLDLIYERRPPFNPNEVAREYGARRGSTASGWFKAIITALASWWASLPSRHVQYQHSYRDRSAICTAHLIPLFTAGNARLLDTPRGVHSWQH